MIYNGNYQEEFIYGTANGHKIQVTTEDEATFLSCKLTVNYNNEEWTHTFECPFFQDNAELYFENYIHSIITQKFTLDSIDKSNIKVYNYDLATVKMELKEMQFNTVLSELEINFYMILGVFPGYNLAHINSGLKQILPVKQSSFITEKSILSFSFLSGKRPEILTIDDGLTTSDIALEFLETENLLHTITIPVSLIKSEESTVLKLTLKFANLYPGSYDSRDLGSFNIFDKWIDHNLIAYQNEYGTLSIMEQTGQLQTDEQYKESIFKHTNNEKGSLSPTKIEIKKMYVLNTGLILDFTQYEMLKSLLKSFNRYLLEDGVKRIILSSAQRITPFKTDDYLRNENLKFKLSENDDIYYRAF